MNQGMESWARRRGYDYPSFERDFVQGPDRRFASRGSLGLTTQMKPMDLEIHVLLSERALNTWGNLG